MSPTLPPGRTVLVDPRAYETTSPEPGDVVLVEREGRVVVKRVAEVTAGRAVVLGDNGAASTDSRQFGPVPVEAFRGRVECTFP